MDLSTLVSPIITIIGGGIMGALVGYLLSSSKDHIFQVRQKIEDLYIQFDSFSDMLGSFYLLHFTMFSGKLSYENLQDLVIKKGGNNERHHGKIAMLIDIYFPQMRPEWDEYNKVRENINKINFRFEKRYRLDRSSSFKDEEALELLSKSLDILDKKVKILKSKIISTAHEVVDKEALYPKILSSTLKKYRYTRSIPLE